MTSFDQHQYAEGVEVLDQSIRNLCRHPLLELWPPCEDVDRPLQVVGGVLPEPGEGLGVGAGNPGRGLSEPLSVGVLSDRFEHLADGSREPIEIDGPHGPDGPSSRGSVGSAMDIDDAFVARAHSDLRYSAATSAMFLFLIDLLLSFLGNASVRQR